MVRTGIALMILASPLSEVQADFPRLGIFRSRKKDEATSEKEKTARVKGLLESLRSEPDEKKRLAAVEELSDYDPRTHVEVLPALIASVKQDPAAGVRALAAEAIGEMKPVNQTAGVALEQTLTNDPSESVRKSAQQALWQYHLNGYRSQGANPSLPQTAEPPLAQAVKSAPKAVVATPVSQTRPVPRGGVYQQTVEPPIAKPRVAPETVSPPTPSMSVPALPPVPVVPTVPSPIVPSVPPPQS